MKTGSQIEKEIERETHTRAHTHAPARQAIISARVEEHRKDVSPNKFDVRNPPPRTHTRASAQRDGARGFVLQGGGCKSGGYKSDQ